jgi:iron-sulfur cluster repair protein YtfE (RIC family)
LLHCIVGELFYSKITLEEEHSMSHNSGEFVAYVVHLRTEHRRLHDWLLSIKRQWPLIGRHSADRAALLKLMGGLIALRAELAHHFEEEESGGCLEEAVSHQPSLSHDVHQLEHEHPELLKRLDRLIEQVREFSFSEDHATTIEQEFRQFADELRAHELAENRILEESFGIQVE